MWLVEVIVDPLFGIDTVSDSISELCFSPALWRMFKLSFVNETVGVKSILRVKVIQLISILS